MIILNENASGGTPNASTSLAYATSLKIKGYPVTADAKNQVTTMTPWDGNGRPGKCALAPNMTILKCSVGTDNSALFKAIQDHKAANP